jgi:hypothetical protein
VRAGTWALVPILSAAPAYFSASRISPAAVPGYLDKTDKFLAVEGADPGECIPFQAPGPRLNHIGITAERAGVQRTELTIINREPGRQMYQSMHSLARLVIPK